LLFLTHDDFFDFKQKADSNDLAVNYIRILIDLCQAICIAPHETFQLNPDSQNPYIDKPNPGFNIQEETIEPSDKVSILQVPILPTRKKVVQCFDPEKFVFSCDFSKSLAKAEVKVEVQTELVKHDLSLAEMNEHQAHASSLKTSELRKLTYFQLKAEILKNWPLQSFPEYTFPRALEERLETALLKFVSGDKRSEFKELLKDSIDEYLKMKEDTVFELASNYKTLSEIIHDKLCSFIQENECKPKIDAEGNLEPKKKEGKGLFTKLKEKVQDLLSGEENSEGKDPHHLKCSNHTFARLNIGFKYKKISFKLLEEKLRKNNFTLHSETERTLESVLLEINNELDQLEKNQADENKKRFIDCKKKLFENVFDRVDSLVVKNKTTNLLYVQLSFFNVNILRNMKEAENFNVTQQPVTIIQKFFKETPSTAHVKSIHFIQEQSGLILFSEFPQNKSSLYYFNISNKSAPTAEFSMVLSSTVSHLLVEPNLKLWCIYDNREQRFNMGKLTSIGKIEDGAPVSVFNEIRESCTIHEIISACFLPFSDSLYIISQDYDLFELRYHSKTLSLVLKKENNGESVVQKSKILPADPYDRYVEIQTTADGKNIILRSQNFLDIYDLSWNKVYSIELDKDFLKFKTFIDLNNHFLIIFKAEETVCYQLAGLSAMKTLKTELTGLKDKTSNGNPIFDYLYLTFRQFGPHSSFIGSPSETRIAFINSDEKTEEDDIRQYFKSLKIPETALEIFMSEDELLESDYLKRRVQEIEVPRFKMILFTRVPLHAATIESFTLIPLQNGKNISDQIAANVYGERSHNLIEKLIELIGFGVYEKFLRATDKQINVISIVGRQSSGKSYIMNREFGTRFNVASARCTDGIWISMAEIKVEKEWKLFVVLDCEGLFSARRNDQEEIKLCLTLAAISDVMILNQDLSFNRHFTKLFNNFSNAIGKLKGRKLFKGYLMMLIRDVKSEAAEGAYKELQSNIIQVTSQEKNFLTALFQGNLKSQCLNYFEQEIFNTEVDSIRKQYFFSLKKKRWETGIDFLESFKITLAQVFMDDDTDMDLHKLNITCDSRFQEAIQMFYEGKDEFDGEKSVFRRTFDFEGQSFDVQISQKDFILDRSQSEGLEEIHLEKKEDNYLVMEIIKIFIEQTIDYSQEIHNIWFKNLAICIEEVMKERISYVLQHFGSKVPNDSNFKEIINSYSFKLKNILNTVFEENRNCQKTCRKCARICVKKLNHTNNCDCETLHTCEIQCTLTPECVKGSYLCVNVFGHDGDHRCSQGSHKCNSPCDMTKCGCTYTCSLEAGHPESVPHNCQNKHPCNERCTDDKCTRTCQFDLTNEHTEHICGDNRCIHKCSLCDKQCVFENHLHDKLIKENKEELLRYEHEGKVHDLYHHSCGNEHACVSKCSQLGVCQIGYNVIEKEWRNDFGSFTYPFFEPKESRQQCKVLIPKFKLEHQEAHDCKIGVHRCSQNCVECKSFCNKDINHDGLHSTNNHRNKENNVFVSSKGKKTVEVASEGKTRVYAIGEFCQPENCTTSCTRKGRAHYHLKECPGGDNCAAKINPYVRHSKERYEPYVDKVFDLWLCANYWNSLKWDVPVQDAVREELGCCNFVCNHSSHRDELVFCKKKAWHQESDHQFDCKHGDDYDASIIDIVFCCDTTGSMGSYIESSKETVKKIVNTAVKLSKPGCKISVGFGFVAYRDHPPEDKTYVTNVQNLTSQTNILQFVATLKADGGGDGAEAVLDGIFDSIHKISWRKNSLRYIFHIADAPAQGLQYSGGISDNFPKGCPCNIKIEDLAASIKEKKIKYKLLKIGSSVNTMASIFKSKIEGYEESGLDSAIDLPIKVTKILARDISTEEQDVLLSGL